MTGGSARKAGGAIAILVSSVCVAGAVQGGTPAVVWQPSTVSPRGAVPEVRLAPLYAVCGTPDAALNEVAARATTRQIEGAPLLPADELALHLRAAGEPHVWPRAWSIAGQALDEEDVVRRLKAWSAGWTTLGVRRCGVARATAPDSTVYITAVAVDALADMSALPTTARTGQWLTLNANMLVPTSEAKGVLLGPRGAPKTILTGLADRRVYATFAVDQPGPWLVQVLSTVSTGPRPVLEAMVFAGMTPPSRFVATQAPGEAAAQGAKDDDDAMMRMLNAARASEERSPLRRDPALDQLAKAHSQEMLKVRMVGHDIGGGDPAVRLKAAGIRFRVAGENCASASSTENAHRALWASPSHRSNLLLDQFTSVGIAVVKGPDGTVWVTELFGG